MPHHHKLPLELYDEITSYLWNDIPSLRACSLANRNMTIPSQKRLFYCIALRAPTPVSGNSLYGTSYNFRQLLLRSPRIANYVQSLYIVNDWSYYVYPACVRRTEDADDGLQYTGYKLENGEDVPLDAPLPARNGESLDEKAFGFRGWLSNDKFLPLCAPLLHNLKALIIFGDVQWSQLSGRVVITLLNLMRLRSLRYLHIACKLSGFNSIITRSLGENVKLLELQGYPEKEFPLRLPYDSLASPYLDSLSIDASDFLSDLPTSQIEISRLRKLVVKQVEIRHYFAISSFFQHCGTTLEDLEIAPGFPFDQDEFAITNDDESIDFSKLTALRRLAVTLTVQFNGCKTRTLFLWLSMILRSSCLMSVSQQLENISIRVDFDHINYGGVTDIENWKVAFDALLEDEFRNLRRLDISIESLSRTGIAQGLELLNNSRDIARLRSRSNLQVLVNGRSKGDSFQFAPDVRWETYMWDLWR